MRASAAMCLELQKIADRRVDIFHALLKKLPKDVAVLEMGKDFPLGGNSPFYAHGHELKALLLAAVPTGKAVAKSVKEDKRYVVVPPPKATGELATRGGTPIPYAAHVALAHEAGHALEHGEGHGGFWHGTAPNLISSWSVPAGIVGGALAGGAMKSPGVGALLGAAVGGGVAGLGQLPLIHREGQASDRAMQLLHDVGATPEELAAAKETLSKAKGTYIREGLQDSLQGTMRGAVGGGLLSLVHAATH